MHAECSKCAATQSPTSSIIIHKGNIMPLANIRSFLCINCKTLYSIHVDGPMTLSKVPTSLCTVHSQSKPLKVSLSVGLGPLLSSGQVVLLTHFVLSCMLTALSVVTTPQKAQIVSTYKSPTTFKHGAVIGDQDSGSYLIFKLFPAFLFRISFIVSTKRNRLTGTSMWGAFLVHYLSIRRLPFASVDIEFRYVLFYKSFYDLKPPRCLSHMDFYDDNLTHRICSISTININSHNSNSIATLVSGAEHLL